MYSRLLTCICAILCIKFTIQVQAGVKISLEFLTFKNPNNLGFNGKCCDLQCGRCDHYFKICLKEGGNSKCIRDVITKQWDNTNDIVFTKGAGALGTSINNPLVVVRTSWKGNLKASIEVMDDDSLTADEVVDKYLIDKPVTPTAGILQQTWTPLTIKGRASTLKLQYSIQCNRDFYGPNCTKYCLARDDSKGHYTCDLKTGGKVCRNGWFGSDCLTHCLPRDDDVNGHYTCDQNTGKKVCLNGWYGPSCKIHCMARNDSRAGYSCNSLGTKICLPDWYPSNQCDVFCAPRNDSTSGYTCNLMTGQKTCLTGWYGPECDCSPRNDSTAGFKCNSTTGERICYPGWYSNHCNVFCTPRNDSSGHYRCNSKNGAKECLTNWFGKQCDIYCAPSNETNDEQTTKCSVNNTIICARNWYGANCSVHCEPRDDDEAHYTCNQQNGQKICHQGWHGENCSTYCKPRDNDWFGHYNCDDNGNKVCRESWYGPDCKRYCKPQNNSLLGYYECKDDGTRSCLEHWYGTKCLRYCKGQNNDQGHYRCGAAGAIVCLENWYSQNCTVYCVPRDDDKGHYTCDPMTGQEVCIAGWTGKNCIDEIIIDPTTPSPLPPKNKENMQTRTESSLSELSLALILGGFLLLICITVGVVIVICSRRQTKRPAQPFPYTRYKNTTTQGSMDRAADIIRDNVPSDNQLKRQSRIPNFLSQYDDSACKEQKDNVVINLQEISWNPDGFRNVDEKLVMYNNPLFIEKQKMNTTEQRPAPDPRVDPVTGLRDNSDWVAIFDSYNFESS